MSLKLDGQTFYHVGEACKLAGTSRITFLRWVRQNKFADVENRDRNGWRLFTEDDLSRLRFKVNHIEKVPVGKTRRV
jgi:DNA-binding transcriptional MerR regulator